MARVKEVNVPLLFKLWNDETKTVEHIAKELEVAKQTVERIRRRYGLHRKVVERPEREATWLPSLQEIEERAAEVRSRWTPEREYQARCRA